MTRGLGTMCLCVGAFKMIIVTIIVVYTQLQTLLQIAFEQQRLADTIIYLFPFVVLQQLTMYVLEVHYFWSFGEGLRL